MSRSSLATVLAGSTPVIYEVLIVYGPFAASALSTGAFRPQVLGHTLMQRFVVDSLEQSLLQGVLSSIAALAMGYPVGIVLGLLSFRGRAAYTSAILLPFMLPSVAVAAGFLLGYPANSPLQGLSHGLSGIIAVNALFNSPLVALFTSAKLSAGSGEVVQAARTSGASLLEVVRRIIVPSTLGAAGGGAFFAFVYSFLGFVIPLTIGGPSHYTSEVAIYTYQRILFSPATATALAIIQILPVVAISLAILPGKTRLTPDFRTANSSAPWPASSKRARLCASLFLLAYLVFEDYPLFAVVISALANDGRGFALLFQPATAERLGVSVNRVAINSITFATLASGVTFFLSVGAVHYMLGNARQERSRLYNLALVLPVAVSPVTIGLAIYLALSGFAVFDLVWPTIVFAQCAVALPVSLRFLSNGLEPLPKNLASASALLGAGKLSTLLEVELPSARGALVSSVVIAFAIGIGEFAATSVLYTPAYTTIPLAIYALLGLRLFRAAAALAAMLIFITVGAYFLILRFSD